MPNWVACRNERFRGNAADVQAVAAHQIAFDQGNFCTALRGPGGCQQACRSRSDHNEVIATDRCRIRPIRGRDQFGQTGIGFIVGKQGGVRHRRWSFLSASYFESGSTKPRLDSF
jgi:hypothetical protein